MFFFSSIRLLSVGLASVIAGAADNDGGTQCYVSVPVSYLSLNRTPERTAYMEATFQPLSADLRRYHGIDSRSASQMTRLLAEPTSLKAAGATVGEVALFISHLKRAYELLQKEKTPVLLLEDDAFPVLPGLWDVPLDTVIEFAGAVYSVAVERSKDVWEPVMSPDMLSPPVEDSGEAVWTLPWASSRSAASAAPMVRRLVKWGSRSVWEKLERVRWLNLKNSLPSSLDLDADVVDLSEQDQQFPWEVIRTDAVRDGGHAAGLNGRDGDGGNDAYNSRGSGNSPIIPGSQWLSAQRQPVHSTASYVAHPRLLAELEHLVVHEKNKCDKYLCVRPCVADVGLAHIVHWMYVPRVELFTSHPLSKPTGVHSARETATLPRRKWPAFAQAHGEAIEQALVELAWSVPAVGPPPYNDFQGVSWTATLQRPGPPDPRSFFSIGWCLVGVANVGLVTAGVSLWRRRRKAGSYVAVSTQSPAVVRRLRLTLRDSLSHVTLRAAPPRMFEEGEESAAAPYEEDDSPHFYVSSSPAAKD